MYRKNLFPIILNSILLFATSGLTGNAFAAPLNGVDHLRGRWDGTFNGLFGEDQSFILLFDDFAADQNDPQATLYNGCMAVGKSGAFAPISAKVLDLGNEDFDLTLYSSAGGAVIKLGGLVETRGPGVPDDSSNGVWQTADGEGEW